jgi:hypothetical protein
MHIELLGLIPFLYDTTILGLGIGFGTRRRGEKRMEKEKGKMCNREGC